MVRSPNCGQLDVDTTVAMGNLDAYRALTANDSLVASTYSQTCYGNTENILQCDQYTQQQIKWNVIANASCPFGDDLCFYGRTSAFEMDSGMMDSHGTLGINAPESNRVQLRKVTTCSPLYLFGHTCQNKSTDHRSHSYGDTVISYLFGQNGNNTYTYSYDLRSVVGDFGYLLT